MDLAGFRQLLTPQGQAALQAAVDLQPREVDFLADFTQLSRRFSAELARPALETAILRLEAQVKFSFASQLYLTRPALEQASSYPVASYRAGRFAGFEHLADLGCSVGCDTLALADHAPVLGVELDPLRLAMAKANLAALGKAGRSALVSADLLEALPIEHSRHWGLFFDPARRTAGRRLYSVKDYLPPLEIVRQWLPRFPALGVKLSPGVNLDELGSYPAGIEFISLHGELKEAVLWFGPLQSAPRQATLLPGPHILAPAGVGSLPLSEPTGWLYEPDPAVLRAGLVAELGAQINACQLDPDIAYLTASTKTPTPFARVWAVEDWFPFQLKRLRSYLRERRVGRVTVKKRGSPLEPEALIQALRLEGAAGRVVFLTHLRGRPVVIVAFEPSS